MSLFEKKKEMLCSRKSMIPQYNLINGLKSLDLCSLKWT